MNISEPLLSVNKIACNIKYNKLPRSRADGVVYLLSKENIEILLSPKQLAVWKYLESTTEATPGEISKNTKVTRPTVSQALDVLMRLKKVKRIGQGRTTRYSKI